MDRKEIVISNVTCSEQFTNYKKADGYKNLQSTVNKTAIKIYNFYSRLLGLPKIGINN